MRELELGLVADTRFVDAVRAVGRALEEPLDDHERLSVGGGRYVDFRLIPNFDAYQREWHYDDRHDICAILRVKTDSNSFDVDPLLRRLSSVEGEWRVLLDR